MSPDSSPYYPHLHSILTFTLVGQFKWIIMEFKAYFKGEQGSKSILDPCVYWENTNHFYKMCFVPW